MKKALLTTALIAALGTSATAQGIAPVTTAPDTDVTVGTQGFGENTALIAVLAAAAIIAAAATTTDGTN